MEIIQLGKLRLNKLQLGLMLAGFTAMTAPIQVQAAEQEEKAELEVIEVTAQRRVQNLQKTPLSVSVIGESELNSRQIGRLDDIALQVPNLVIAPNTGTSSGAKIFMRGVGEDNSTFTNDPAIGMYVDGVYFARQTGALVDVYDLERVEVLRGPQGTLYGRNTSGGAIKYITKKPTGENEGYVQVTFGNMGRADLKFAGDYALSDSVAVQVAALRRGRDGYSYNTVTEQEVNDQDVLSARLGLMWTIDADSSLYINYDMMQDESTAGFASNIIDDPDNNKYTLESAVTGPNEVDQNGLSATYTTAINDSIDFEIIAAYRSLENPWHGDFDAKEAVVLEDRWFLDQEQTSIEAQFSGKHGKFDWLAGVFFFEEDNELSENVDVLPIFLGPSPTNDFSQETSSNAIFAHVSYALDEKWTLTGGLRYTEDEKDITVIQTLASGAPGFNSSDSHSWDNTSYKLGVDYQYSDSVLFFAYYCDRLQVWRLCPTE